jgi:hypothetical protein
MAEERVIVKAKLRVQRKHAAIGRSDKRIDLAQ